MSTAGQANEAGSVFRRDAAVYFAVHALIGKPLPALNPSRRILRLDFETPDPTDDIVLALEGGGRAFVSAKNRIDAGKPFKDTVSGWLRQLDTPVGPDDLLVVVFGTCAGWVHELSAGLRRLRAGQALSRPAEISALKKLDDLLPENRQDEVHRRARLLHIPGSAVTDDTAAVLEALLGSIIEGEEGVALSVLASGLHTLAGSAMGADVPALVAMLEAREGLRVRIGSGTAAAVEAATRAALESYLGVFLGRRGRLDLPFLADDLGPLPVHGLYDALEVVDTMNGAERAASENLGRIVRRRRRALLVGQPGSGKSVATWEIAAACADNPDAPLPIRVHLPELLPILPVRDLEVADIITAGAKTAPESSRALLEARLAEAAAQGDVMLVLDGLDECREQAAGMAEQLRKVIDALHPEAGVVLATRASAEVPAGRLGLPRLDLSRPNDLDHTMDAVLVECARVRVREDQRAAWLAARRSWIREVRTAQPDLLDVPQLALLLVLVVAERSQLDVPKQRAELLHAAVVRSVERWEFTRFKGSGLEWAVELSPRMLLDGFEALGRMLDTAAITSRSEGLSGLAAMLMDKRWGLAAGRAEELAREILRFWDEHVAVFTVDEAGTLSSRSRVFTEVATAMWTKRCDEHQLRAWASEAIRFRDSDGVLGLAQGLNPQLVQALLAMGMTDPEASLAVGTAAVDGGITLDRSELQLLTTQLMKHIAAINAGLLKLSDREPRGPSGASMLTSRRGEEPWPLVKVLCALKLPTEARDERRDFVAGLPATGSEKVVLNAWVVLTDATHDARELSNQEVETVQAAVNLEFPPREPLIKTSRRSFSVNGGRRAPRGVGAVALLAVRYLPQLSEPSAERIYRASMMASVGELEATERALQQAGVDTKPWRDWGKRFAALFKELVNNDHDKAFLDDIATLHDGHNAVALRKAERWSLKDLGDLVFASGCLSADVSSFRTAFVADSPKVRTDWLTCVATSYGVDIAAAASQARHLLSHADSEPRWTNEWWVAMVRPSNPPQIVGPGCLTAEEQISLLAALEANSDWIAWSAGNILTETDPQWDTDAVFSADRSNWRPRRAVLFPLVAILASPHGERLLGRAVTSADAVYRQAARWAVISKPSLDPGGEVARLLSLDDDLTVRGDMDAGKPPPLHWSCTECRAVNPMHVVDCPHCEEGTRPGRPTDTARAG